MSDLAPLLHVTATFSADALAEYLDFWKAEGWPWDVSLAAHGQVFQELLDPSSRLRANRRGANLLLVRPADLARPVTMASELAAALKAGSSEWSVPLILILCPGSSDDPKELEAGRALRELTHNLVGVHELSFARAMELYRVNEVFDEAADALASVPYTAEAHAALATIVVRHISMLERTPSKVVALDCDNTLWGGVVGEDGASALAVGGVWELVQSFMLEKRDEGLLLCLCSRNEEADVDAVFEAHPDMPLKRSHIIASRIGWDRKSTGIVELGKELGLAADSFIFVDDSPIECAEVACALPGTRVIRLPQDEERIPHYLEHVWAFDCGPLTAADRRRATMYEESVRRERSRRESTTLAGFIDSLALEVDIHPLRAEELERASQLSQRTNQFNFGSIRRSATEIRRFLDQSGAGGLSAKVSDRFGDYGFVGLSLFRAADGILDVDTFLLSCRALGRGVEYRLLSRLAATALELDCPLLRLTHARTERNEPAWRFLCGVSDETELTRTETGGIVRTSAVLRSTTSSALRYVPERSHAEAKPLPVPAGSSAPRSDNDWPDDNRIAEHFYEAAALVETEREQRRRRADTDADWSAGGPPQGRIEQQIAAIWCEVLLRDEIGRDVDFFAIGGSSLLAIAVIVRLDRAFALDLSLEILFAAPTLRRLAAKLEDALSQTVSGEL